MNRAEAWQLVTEWTESESLRHHMQAVEAAMRAYARRFGEDEELWGVAGLIHDFDYEKYPDMTAADGHPITGLSILRDMGMDADDYRTIAGPCRRSHGRRPALRWKERSSLSMNSRVF